MSTQAEKTDYYFVPLGREPGGYLDTLGLPPNVSEMEAKRKEGQYRKDIKTNYKLDRKEFKSKQDAGQITQEEFDVELKKLDETKTEELSRLNKLKENYELILARKRSLANKGLRDDSEPWAILHYEIRGEIFWRKLLTGRPLPMLKVDPSELSLKEIAEVIEENSNILQVVLERLLPHRTDSNPTVDGSIEFDNLKALRDIIKLRDQLSLSVADLLWYGIKFTNRKIWVERAMRWSENLEKMGPTFSLDPLKDVDDVKESECPAVSTPTSSFIQSLMNEEFDDLHKQPKRLGDTPLATIKELMRKIAQSRKSDAPEDESSILEEILKLMESRAK